MGVHSLHSPNRQDLRDGVIDAVRLRASTPPQRAIRRFKVIGATKSLQSPNFPTKHHSHRLPRGSDTCLPNALITSSPEISPGRPELTKMSTRKTKSDSNRKRLSTSLTHEEIRRLIAPSTKAMDSSADDLLLSDLVNLANTSEVLYRERRRLAQIRYRKKQQEYIRSLEEDADKLREEIHDLNERRHHVVVGTSRAGPSQRNTFGCFTMAYRKFCILSRSFLSKVMSSDVMNGSMCGPEVILQSWRLFSLCFENINVEVEQLEKGVALNTIVVVTTTSFTISKCTLALVFPHLDNVEQGAANAEKRSKIASELVGQRLAMRGSALFEWDPQINRVVRVQSHQTC